MAQPTTKQLLRHFLNAGEEVATNYDIRNHIQVFAEYASPWEVDIFQSPDMDDLFIRFHCPDHADRWFFLRTNDNQNFIPLTFRYHDSYFESSL